MTDVAEHPQSAYELAPDDEHGAAGLRPLGHVLEHMSDSKLGLWQRCPFAFFLRYVVGWKERPSASMAIGRGWDAALDGAMKAKQVEGCDPNPTETADRFEAAAIEELGMAAIPEDFDAPAQVGSGARLAKAWAGAVAPRMRPLAVQPDIEYRIEQTEGPGGPARSFRLKGYADLVVDLGGREVVVDNKTSRARWSAGDAQDGTQPALYTSGASRLFGRPIGAVEYHVAVLGTKTPALQRIERTVTDAERAGTDARMVAAHRAIEATGRAGAWVPNRAHFLCSRRWCGYWRHCEKVWGPAVKP